MQYLLTFLEGLISFISPCMLPMLPLYISYFTGGADGRHRPLPRAIGFVIGFSTIFTLLGLLAGTLGSFLIAYRSIINIVCGVLVIIFGLSYLEVIKLPFFRGMAGAVEIKNVFSAFLFGIVYAVGLTPCVGAFLGSALMLASTSGKALVGMLLLLVYSLGLGVPFLLSAVLLDKLGTAFAFIKKHYRVINMVCGIFLILLGILMATGLLGAITAVFS